MIYKPFPVIHAILVLGFFVLAAHKLKGELRLEKVPECVRFRRYEEGMVQVDVPRPGRPLEYFMFSLIGLKKTLFTNIFQRL